MDIQETQNMINDMQNKLGNLLDGFESTIKNLPNDVRKQMNFTKTDMDSIRKAVQNGDLSKLDELTKRYAGTDIK
jgi:hypothetical protein